MRTRRAFRPVVEDMPRLALLSGGGVVGIIPGGSVYVPTNPLLPVRIPSTPPPTYFIDPNTPYRITIPVPYHEPVVGPDDPPPATDPGFDPPPIPAPADPGELICLAPGPLAPPPPAPLAPPPPAPLAPPPPAPV